MIKTENKYRQRTVCVKFCAWGISAYRDNEDKRS